MRLLITGLAGTLAPHLARAAQAAGHEVLGWDHARLPPDSAAAGEAWLAAARPDAIVHLAMGSPDWAARLASHVAHHYGRYKIACEDAVRAAHPGAAVARIGWQIDGSAQGNHMLAQLDQWQARDGRIGASRLWKPACSFMADTAAALLALVEAPRAGVQHLDSNAREGHTFDAIVAALADRFERGHWLIAPNDDYRHDQRLVGDEALMPSLSQRLPALRC
jgi:dTDP-4-dehydrorhamnose reductase